MLMGIAGRTALVSKVISVRRRIVRRVITIRLEVMPTLIPAKRAREPTITRLRLEITEADNLFLLVQRVGSITSTNMGRRSMSRSSNLKFVIACLGFCIVVWFPTCFAYGDNLSNCLDGKYPILCDKSKLNDQQRKQAENAERRENLNTCLSGRYPSLCKKQLLNTEELSKAIAAEDQQNLSTCLTGKYPSLCKKNRLTENQRITVEKAEKAENLNTCLSGRFKILCKHELLTPSESNLVTQAEKNYVPPPSSSRKKGGGYRTCESGHWIDAVMSDGEIVKLEDGSLWEIDSGDQIDTMLWLPMTDIVACPDKLINTEDNETAGARRLR